MADIIESYYKKTVPKLIEKYQTLIDQCLTIMGEEIDDELSDDKMLNVLKAKRQASEDAKYYAKEIDSLENEMNGVEEETVTETKSFTKRYAKKPS